MIIDRRYNGPPDSGHGGYVCGALAGFVEGPAEITLRHPPPLGRPLTVGPGADGGIVLTDGPTVLAEARAVDPWQAQVPPPPDLAAAAAAGLAAPQRDPALHTHPLCFGCGTGRSGGDGLGIVAGLVPGPVSETARVADVWVPGAAVDGGDGTVGAEFLWAALDCPSGFAWLTRGDPPPMLLGRMSAMLLAPVPVGEPVVCTGWVRGESGRRLMSASALSAGDGTLLATADAVWITLVG